MRNMTQRSNCSCLIRAACVSADLHDIQINISLPREDPRRLYKNGFCVHFFLPRKKKTMKKRRFRFAKSQQQQQLRGENVNISSSFSDNCKS
jgi:hypothetical protein